MDIKLQEIVPNHLKKFRSSEVWGNSLALKQGEKILISGPSGQGKTTFISILYGLETPYTGEVQLGPHILRKISQESRSELRQRNLAIVFQDLRLFSSLSAMENIRIKAELTQTESPDDIRNLSKALAVDHLLEQKTQTLSLGEKQRICILRALCQPFQWLYLDEPFSHLDSGNRKKAGKLIIEACRERGAGLIITNHDQDNTFEYDRRLVL